MNTKKRTSKEEQFGDTSKLKHGWLLTLIFSIFSVVFISPIFIVLMNSFKQKSFINLQPFSLPTGETFVKLENYARGLEQTGFFDAFKNSLIITVLSVALIIEVMVILSEGLLSLVYSTPQPKLLLRP